MRIEVYQLNEINIAELLSDDIIINSSQDALDLMADCGYRNANRIIIYEKNIATSFFDLKTGLAGEILQKFSNYRFILAIVGDFSKYTSKSLRDFIFESNKGKLVYFAYTVEDAREKLSSR